MIEWHERMYWGNTLQAYLVAAGIVLLGVIVLKLLKGLALRRLRKFAGATQTGIDDLILNMLEKGVLPLLYIVLVYFSLKTLWLSPFLTKTLKVAMAVVTVFFIVRILTMGVSSLLEYYFAKQGKTEAKNAMNGVMIITQIVLWVFGVVFLLGNLGLDIGSILAGLGIGGIAIALAAQNILGDIFAYFSILFDRPYEVGEFLIVGERLGTVTYIGVKTTRIQSLSGEELSFSNHNMLNEWIHNYSRMEKRRVVFGFNVAYGTPADKLEQIPGIVKEIILAQDKVELDRVHFAQFKEYYLFFEAVYYSMEPGYTEYMDKQQRINLAIYRKLEKMGVQFAFSTTRNVFLQTADPDSPKLPQPPAE